jgi:hypothetical protein
VEMLTLVGGLCCVDVINSVGVVADVRMSRFLLKTET